MKSLAELEHARQAVERNHTFAAICRAVALSRGQWEAASEIASADPRTPRQAIDVLKAAVPAGGLSDPDYSAANLVGIQAAFAQSLAQTSAFDAMLPSTRRVPLRTRLISQTSALTGATPAEGTAKPVSSMVLAGEGVARRKASTMFAVSEDVLRAGGSHLEALLLEELRRGTSRSTNVAFLSELATAGTGAPALSSVDFETDLHALLQLLDIGESSKLFLIGESKPVAKARLQLDLVGGSTGNITMLASDSLPSGVALLVDADGLAAGTEPFVLDSGRHTSLQLDTEPTMASSGGSPEAPTATSTVSMWQTNSVALRAERFWGYALIRPNAVAAVSGVTSTWAAEQ